MAKILCICNIPFIWFCSYPPCSLCFSFLIFSFSNRFERVHSSIYYGWIGLYPLAFCSLQLPLYCCYCCYLICYFPSQLSICLTFPCFCRVRYSSIRYLFLIISSLIFIVYLECQDLKLYLLDVSELYLIYSFLDPLFQWKKFRNSFSKSNF